MTKEKFYSYEEPVDFAVSHNRRGDMDKFAPSMTRQEFAEECDINTIMARYESTGALTHVNRAVPIYMDMTDMPDLRGALDIMRVAGVAFAALPAKVRREFDNDPQKFVDFAQNPENLKQMRDWGLAPMPEEPPPPVRVEMVQDAVSPGPLIPTPPPTV